MKNKYFQLFLKITLSSFISLFLFVFFSALIIAPIKEIPIVWVANLVIALLLSVIFCVILFLLQYKTNQLGEKLFWSDFPETVDYDVKKDVRHIFAREKGTLIMFCAIIMGSWLLYAVDSLIFGGRTITAPSVIYGPMYLFCTLLPTWFYRFFGYVFSCLALCVVYIGVQVFFHKKWYKEYRGDKRSTKS
jgi:hypothetical protein